MMIDIDEKTGLPTDFGQRLKRARVAAGRSQQALAVLLEVQPQTIWNWENSVHPPQPRHRALLKDAFPNANLFGQSPHDSPAGDRASSVDRARAVIVAGMDEAEEATRNTFNTFENRAQMRKLLLRILGDIIDHGGDVHLEAAAKALLKSKEALALYALSGAGTEQDMCAAMELLGGALSQIAERSKAEASTGSNKQDAT